jgi:hypothetical protein
MSDDQRDNAATILALGVLAYIGETLLHEGLGHGGACLVLGGHIKILAPLWMRCSVDAPFVVAAGPAMNFLASCLFLCIIWFVPPNTSSLRLLLWLSFAFNSLVACGYIVVGGASSFGDWGVLFNAVSPSLLWRIPAVIAGVAGYYCSLALAAAAYRRLEGHGVSRGRLWKRTLVPAIGAACVAVLAEIVGGRDEFGPLSLALGCTLLVGLSLTQMPGFEGVGASSVRQRRAIGFSFWLTAAALVVAATFVFVIGPGLDLSRLL